jgi:hypothetical protein
VKNREAVMQIKLSAINEMLPEVQDGDDAFTIWRDLRNMHETSDNS